MDWIRLVMIAFVPGIALMLAMYFYDRFDREPISLLVKLFAFGALSVIPTFFVEKFISRFNYMQDLGFAAYNAFIVAGLTEEFFKYGVVRLFAFNHKAFNEKLDGIIYCAYAAMGFATVENVMYVVIGYQSNPHIGIVRGLLSVPAHLLFGVTMGYYLSMARFCKNPGLCARYNRLSLLVPILLHGTFDFILMADVPFLMTLFIPFVIYLWVVNLKKLNEYYKESKLGLRV